MYKSYDEYLRSPTWAETRNRIIKRDKGKCRFCGSGINVRVHHIRYPDVWGEERDEDLIVLCDRCHAMVHWKDTREKQQKVQMSERRRVTREWINQEKKRDFLYGGFENMCSLTTLKNSQADYIAEHGCEDKLLGVTQLQVPLGYAHWLLVKTLYLKGYRENEICLMTGLERNTVTKYLAKDRSSEEETWDSLISLLEIKSVVRRYVEEH